MEDKKVLLAQLEAIIRLHEKMRGSYFYSPPRKDIRFIKKILKEIGEAES